MVYACKWLKWKIYFILLIKKMFLYFILRLTVWWTGSGMTYSNWKRCRPRTLPTGASRSGTSTWRRTPRRQSISMPGLLRLPRRKCSILTGGLSMTQRSVFDNVGKRAFHYLTKMLNRVLFFLPFVVYFLLRRVTCFIWWEVIPTLATSDPTCTKNTSLDARRR